MKKFALIILLWVVQPVSAMADVIVNNTGASTSRELPGNATVIEGGNSGVTLNYYNDDSLIYRTLVRPNINRGPFVSNSVPLSEVNRSCSGASSVTEQNRCIGDLIREKNRMNRRYND